MSGASEIAFRVQWPADASNRFLNSLGAVQFDGEQIASINDAARDGQFEFRIRYHSRWQISEQFVN